MAATAVIIILSTITMLRMNTQISKRIVEREAELFYSAVTYARNLTRSGKVFRDEDGDLELDVPNGYGAHIPDVAGYVIFGDLFAGATAQSYDAGEEINLGATIFDGNVGVNLYDLNGIPMTTPVDIFFETPGAEMFLSGSACPCLGVKVEFFHVADPLLKRTVIMRGDTGQIYVE